MKEIDKEIKAHFKSKSLSKDQLNRIVNGNKNVQNKSWKPFMKYAAFFCLLFLSFFLYQNYALSKKKLSKKYAKEVAFNHLKNLESDILTPNVSVLNDKMDKLDFEIHIPEKINNQYALLGGRYCSIDERLAAQLKLKDKQTNLVVTLYVLDKLKRENLKESFLIDSTDVQIWNEKSNLFVLAFNTPE